LTQASRPVPGSGTRLVLSDEVTGRHPDVLVGGLRVSNLRTAADTVAGQPFPDDTARALVSQDVTIELVADHPLVRDWRAATAVSGLKPSTHKSRPEQLARRALSRGLTRTNVPVVDLCCDVATRHVASLGAYDVDRLPIAAAIELRLARPETDTFAPLGGGEVPLTDRVVVYAIGSTVICWAYNCRESRETCLTEDTDTGLFLGEAVAARQHGALRAALDDLAERLAAAGAVVGPVAYADSGHPEVRIAVE